jgi:hypothetical protein
MDMPNLRPDGVRAAAQHPLHDAGRAGGRADLERDVMPHGGGGQEPPHHQLIAGRLLDLPMSAYRSELREPVSACSARAAILISAFIRAMISFRAR